MKLDHSIWKSFETYLYVERKLSRKTSSYQANKSRFNKLIEYFLNTEFTRDHFNTFISEMQDAGYTASYMNNLVKLAKHLDRFLGLNMLQDYTYFKEKKQMILDILSSEEIDKLAHVEIPYKKNKEYLNKRQRTLILLLGTTGCRIDEALSLKRSDIHSTPYFIILRDTKNGDDRRVPVSEELYKLLLELPAIDDIIFHSNRHGNLDSQQVNLDLKRRAKAVGLTENVYAHLFRHSYVTTMLENGVDMLDVAVIVGHKDPKTTMRYKNSLIDHYVAVSQVHPLLKKDMKWEQVSENVRKLLSKTVDMKSNSLSITETDGQMVIRIERNGLVSPPVL